MRIIILFILVYCCHSHAQDSLIVVKEGTSFWGISFNDGLIPISAICLWQTIFQDREVCDRATFGTASKETIMQLNL